MVYESINPTMLELPQFIKESWIGKFFEYTKPLPTPDIFKIWSGISCVMGALERRVWLKSVGKTLYASHYILLVAPPGVGKSMVIEEVRHFWIQSGVLKIGPDSATKAAMADELKLAQRSFKIDNELIIFHSLQIASTEFGTLINAYDHDTMNFYNRIWDCPPMHTERLRYGDHKTLDIDYPQINLLAGTQPAYLGAILPPDAFGMGFTARLLMIYSGLAVRPKLFGEDTELDPILEKDLTQDIRRITSMVGQMHLEKDAMEYLEAWHLRNDDCPDHPRLATYSVRRTMIVQKILLAISAAGSSSLRITFPMVEFAINLLLEAEDFMPEVFRGMNVPETSTVMAELHRYALECFMRGKKKSVPEHMLIDWLKERVEAYKIDAIMKHMVTSGLLIEGAKSEISNGSFQLLGRRFTVHE